MRDELLTEAAHTTTLPIARFKARKPEPPARRHDDAVTSEPGLADDDRQPVIAVNDQGLTLGLDSSRAWIIWDRTNTVWAAQDRLPWLLPLLERPPDALAATVTATGAESLLPALLRFALESSSRYWAGLALGWLEAGFPATDVDTALANLKDSTDQPQPLRHRALRLWRKATTT
jgi:hypothetical protein